MKVGIIGSGRVAQALGDGFVKHGLEVMLGTREPGKLADWVARNPAAQTGTVASTAEFGELAFRVFCVTSGLTLSSCFAR